MKKSTTITLVALGVSAVAAAVGVVAYRWCNKKDTCCLCSSTKKKDDVKEVTEEEIVEETETKDAEVETLPAEAMETVSEKENDKE